MKYTVVWHRTAENKLAEIWNEAADRQAVTRASNRIDLELIHSPETKGRDLFADRLLLVAPLAVIYAVHPADCKVEVLQVWRW